MPLDYLLHYQPGISGRITGFLQDGEIYTVAQCNRLLHSDLDWIVYPEETGSVSFDNFTFGFESIPLELSEKPHSFLTVGDKLEIAATSLFGWKHFAIEFSIAPETVLSKYLSDPVIAART